ncbi:probable methyltransferase PMT12 isoform X3 [Triticum dicoccoides]|uniref:probable methyltransferase PMT12 isoform X3 n=1 Tax=Triticum dicoccoides TaxID=85692 RepID=UPI00189044A3|nr:probable methyltransferase PMT12 isoform X3 [Triticum dicoccoides]
MKLRKHVTFIVAWFMDHRRHRQVLLQGRDIEEGSTRGRKQVWFSNVPHTYLVADKGGQNWCDAPRPMCQARRPYPRHGLYEDYLTCDIAFNAVMPLSRASTRGRYSCIKGVTIGLQRLKMVPSGSRTRVFLDVGFGVTSFGPYLISREFEHGVPVMVATNLTPAIIQCSCCRINSTCDGELSLFISMKRPNMRHGKICSLILS